MKLHEYNEMMAYLLRPRQNFSNGGIAGELKEFIEKFKLENGRIPTQNEIIKGTGRASKTIKSYLVEGVDYAKPLTNLEAAKLGGRKLTGPLKVDKNLIKQFNELKIKGIYPSFETYKSGSKAFRVKFDKKLGLKEIGGPATKEKLKEIKTTVSEVLESDNYTKNILPFQTDEEKRKFRTFQRNEYKKQDPRNIYKQLQDYKREKYPNLSFNENIQHGQSKFSTQTLSRFGLLPKIDNQEGPVKTVERIRDNNLKTTLATLQNPNASVASKKAAAEKYNSLVKGLRGQLKGTNVQGFVNFETFEVDEKGNFKKIKDIGFDPKKGMAYNNILGNKPLDKLTDAEADEILKLGKKHIDLQLLPKTIEGVTTADKAPVPEKTKTREMFEAANNRLSANPFLNPKNILTGLGDVARVLSTPTVAATFAGTKIKENLEKGESLPEAFADVEVGTNLLYPELAKRTVGQIAPRGTGILSTIGRVAANPFFRAARAFTPVGAGLTAIGLGKDAYERYQELEAMSPAEREELAKERDEFSFGEFSGA